MTGSDETRSLYFDLLKRCLTNWIYGRSELTRVQPDGIIERLLERFLAPEGVLLARMTNFDSEKRRGGLDWPPPNAHTMIGLKRLDNLQFCLEDVIANGVPGDVIETGVWRGGATIFMRAVLKAYKITDRRVWVADSFFLKGWFRDTLPHAPIDRLAVLRLDGDMYESTIVALQSLYPKVSVGGYVIVDDYCIKSCAKAVDDFRAANAITGAIRPIDGSGVFWRKDI